MNDEELQQFEAADPETRAILRKMKEKERKPLNTYSMLETAFFKNLKDPKMRKLAGQLARGGQVKLGKEQGDDQGEEPGEIDYFATAEEREAREETPSGPKQPSLYERTTVQVADLREYLIHSFGAISNDDRVASVFTNCIKKAEDIMSKLGFELDDSEKFNPIMHCSGLKQDNILKNAQQVMENTKTHYSTYKIAGTDVSEYQSHPSVSVKIEGEDGGKPFCVIGTVVAKSDFAGNEAIDYVRRGGQGMFSVKAYKLGRWENVSNGFRIGVKAVQPEVPAPSAPPPA